LTSLLSEADRAEPKMLGTTSPGKVNWVRIDIDAAANDVDHLIAPEERFKALMAKQ